MATAKHRVGGGPRHRQQPAPLAEQSGIYQLGYDIGSDVAQHGHWHGSDKISSYLLAHQAWNLWMNLHYWRTPPKERPVNLCELKPSEVEEFRAGWRRGFREHV